jgi:tetratricopeptide (TPR) repeat protein
MKDAPPEYVNAMAKAAEHHRNGEFRDALNVYNHCLGYMPEDGFALYLAGTLFSHMGLNGISIQLLRTAVAIDPGRHEAWHNLGVAYRNEEHSDRSVEAYRQALAHGGRNAETLAMLAGALVNEGTPKEAEKYALESLALGETPHARNHLALALLEQGRYREGWLEYEKRWDLPERAAFRRSYAGERWSGEPVDTLIVHGEQGIGDELLYLTCLEDIPAKRIVVECTPRLVGILRQSGIEAHGSQEEVEAAGIFADAWIPMGDLPRLYRNCLADFPKDFTGYLHPDENRVHYWRQRLEAEGPGPYAMIAWAGGLKTTSQSHRTPALKWWDAILKRKMTFVSGHYMPEAAAQAERWGIPHWQEAVDDLSEYAALMEACDVVVSVCQTAVHFAGALGKPCLCIAPDKMAWRYVDGMPWYPGVEILKKQKDWGIPFTKAARRLADFRKVQGRSEKAA